MTIFFSVDVETTGLEPFNPDHKLISVGAVAVSPDGLIGDTWYSRLAYEDSWDPATRDWWMKQNEIARAEAMSDMVGAIPVEAAHDFVAWVQEWTEHPVFVANPATFDHAWIRRWMYESSLELPFDYRTLCLRSADWGRNPGPWGLERNGHQPVVPHHALHDAQAQAFDLIELLKFERAQ